MSTDVTEQGLESRICTILAGHPCDPAEAGAAGEPPAVYGGVGWSGGHWRDYDREHCLDLAQLVAFVQDTQAEAAEALGLDVDGPARRRFLGRLRSEIDKRGTVQVLRQGVDHASRHVDLYYVTPSPGNESAAQRFAQNRFTVTRQLRYSAGAQRALDIALFINGLPVATFELKNSLTKQTVEDAKKQYRTDRDPREPLFALGRCAAHFAVDESEAYFCTHLLGKDSWFLPFNRGHGGGAGNPPNSDGSRTDYLWREVLSRESLANVLERFSQLVESKGESGGARRDQVWPRYHQLAVVRSLLDDAERRGAGHHYLIQHSAGSGKSNSIAWLAQQLIGLRHDEQQVFDSIIVVTDRRVLDAQITATIKQFAQVRATIGHAERSADLRKDIEGGKKIIISTLQKFPLILDEIGDVQRNRRFAIIIDEAHSSQGGSGTTALAQALSPQTAAAEDETFEDKINRLIESKRLLPNASYFAFTATPKAKTLEIFGTKQPQGDGTTAHSPFHSYSMKQAIEEGFILDVLGNYTPVKSYYRLTKTVEEDPEFDTRRANKKLRRYVETHDHAVRLKAEIMADHFHEQVWRPRKIGGQARAMVVTNGVAMAIQYHRALAAYLHSSDRPYRALVAFSGEREDGGAMVTESSLNDFPGSQIAQCFRQEPYRILVCADKFQTGYDEPLLHTMYVDKPLSGIRAVQTLSRLNRADPRKREVFVLDFANDTETIKSAFEDYYRTTILSEGTDPDKLHDLKSDLDGYEVYAPEQVEELARLYLAGAERGRLEPILDLCVENYRELDEDGQVDFKHKAKAFLRTYGYLAVVLSYTLPAWETLSIFLHLLVPRLPAPVEEDLSKGILNAIDMDSYRIEKQAVAKIALADDDAQLEPLAPGGGGGRPEPETDRLSNIIAEFNSRFGSIDWQDADRPIQLVTQELPKLVVQDESYLNASANSDRQNARIELDAVLASKIPALLKDDAEFFKQFTTNESFKRFVVDKVFGLTYRAGPPP